MSEAVSLAFLRGLGLGASLIVAIGAQNAFVLRQGLTRRYVLPVVLTCALSDALLIALGVAGAGAVVTRAQGLLHAVTWAGAAYLVWFGVSALRRAWGSNEERLVAAAPTPGSLGRTLATALALTYLNPHVYLDTVVLLGSVGAREGGAARGWFAAGAMLASFVWFFGLGFGARLLAPAFARPVAWRVLDAAIGVTVLAIAVSLVV